MVKRTTTDVTITAPLPLHRHVRDLAVGESGYTKCTAYDAKTGELSLDCFVYDKPKPATLWCAPVSLRVPRTPQGFEITPP